MALKVEEVMKKFIYWVRFWSGKLSFRQENVRKSQEIFKMALHGNPDLTRLKARHILSCLLTNWLAYLYRRIQSPRPDVMPDRREGITRAAGFGFACIDTQAS